MLSFSDVAVGGVIGYRKAGSRNSLLSSLAVAAGMAASAYQISSNGDSYLGIFTALCKKRSLPEISASQTVLAMHACDTRCACT